MSEDVIESMLAGTFPDEPPAQTKIDDATAKIAGLIKSKDYDGAMAAADKYEKILPPDRLILAEISRVGILTAKGEKGTAFSKLKKLFEDNPSGLPTQYQLLVFLTQSGLKDEKGVARFTLDRIGSMSAQDSRCAADPTIKAMLASATKALEAKKNAQ